jgi:hypothetical protein
MTGMDVFGAAATLEALNDLKTFAENVEYRVGTNVEYAVYVEFGTSKMRAQPYLRPAVKEVVNSKGDALAADADDVEEFVKKLAFEIEREAKDRAPVDTGTLQNSISAQRVK